MSEKLVCFFSFFFAADSSKTGWLEHGPTHLCTNSYHETRTSTIAARNKLNAGHPRQAFPSKLYEILEGENPDIIGWTATGRGFEVGLCACVLDSFFIRFRYLFEVRSLHNAVYGRGINIQYVVRIIFRLCCAHSSQGIGNGPAAVECWHAKQALTFVCPIYMLDYVHAQQQAVCHFFADDIRSCM